MTNPREAALVRDAIEALRRGDLDGAGARCATLLDASPKCAEAYDVLARLEHERGDKAASIAHQVTAVKLAPKDARLRTNLGRHYLRDGAYTKALAQFEKALKLAPGDPITLSEQARVFERQGKHERGARLIRPHLAGGRTHPLLAAVAFRLLEQTDETDAARDLGEAVLAATTEPSRGLRQLALQLARRYEREERYDDALAAAARGNAIDAVPYDRDSATQRVERLLAHDRAAPPVRIDFEADPQAPIFVFGMARSGTTLVERILHRHPAVHGAGETGAVVRALAAGGTELPDLHDDARIDALRATTLELIARDVTGAGSARLADKSLDNINYAGIIARILPAAPMIWCRRDPADNCLACYFERLVPTGHPYAGRLEDAAHHCRLVERLGAYWATALPRPPLVVSYEEIVADLETVARRIVAHCGLEWDDACLRFHEAKRHDGTLSFDQVRRPIYASSVGRAARYGERLADLHRALAT